MIYICDKSIYIYISLSSLLMSSLFRKIKFNCRQILNSEYVLTFCMKQTAWIFPKKKWWQCHLNIYISLSSLLMSSLFRKIKFNCRQILNSEYVLTFCMKQTAWIFPKKKWWQCHLNIYIIVTKAYIYIYIYIYILLKYIALSSLLMYSVFMKINC